MKLFAPLLAAAVLLASPALATAAKPAPTAAAPAAIALNESDPHLGGTVSFTVSYDSRIKLPRIDVSCTQNGEIVYADAAPVGTVFTLGAYWSPWVEVGGPAACTATLYYFVDRGGRPQQVVVLARTTFAAAG